MRLRLADPNPDGTAGRELLELALTLTLTLTLAVVAAPGAGELNGL